MEHVNFVQWLEQAWIIHLKIRRNKYDILRRNYRTIKTYQTRDV